MTISNNSKILIIDDSLEIQESLKLFLENQGCTVYTASGGEEGLALARINDFRAILIDVCMPGLGGEEVLLKMKELFPETPIIMITGFEDQELAQKCMDSGAYDYITKPFDFEYLMTSVLSTVIYY